MNPPIDPKIQNLIDALTAYSADVQTYSTASATVATATVGVTTAQSALSAAQNAQTTASTALTADEKSVVDAYTALGLPTQVSQAQISAMKAKAKIK